MFTIITIALIQHRTCRSTRTYEVRLSHVYGRLSHVYGSVAVDVALVVKLL